ncbi:MAG: Wadjet anti-phage system protein JetD domain-containing protein [Pseudoclavibacter sp.]
MIGVAEARAKASASLERHLADWASTLVISGPTIVRPQGSERLGSESAVAVMRIPLNPPSEREMLSDQRAVELWRNSWDDAPHGPGIEIEWAVRAWRSIGRQTIPVRLVLNSPDAVANFAGGAIARRWHTIRRRAISIAGKLAVPPGASARARLAGAARRHFSALFDCDAIEFERIVDVASWLVMHPVAGFRPRQLPIRGIDTKWFGHHRAIVLALHAAVTDGQELGIVTTDPLIRIRILDPQIAPSGIADFAAPSAQLAMLDLHPERLFLCENLESVLAMPAATGAVVVHGSGFAVDVVAKIPWIQASNITYWGDLDSHGFAILHRLRKAHSRVASVLMDEQTLLAHRDLWVPEPVPARGTYSTLTAPEQKTLERLRDEGDVRLEQERIPWEEARRALNV